MRGNNWKAEPLFLVPRLNLGTISAFVLPPVVQDVSYAINARLHSLLPDNLHQSSGTVGWALRPNVKIRV
jgi:hypothetical protein